jgi:hypothetical protein
MNLAFAQIGSKKQTLGDRGGKAINDGQHISSAPVEPFYGTDMQAAFLDCGDYGFFVRAPLTGVLKGQTEPAQAEFLAGLNEKSAGELVANRYA